MKRAIDLLTLMLLLAVALPVAAFVVDGSWDDDDNILMQELFPTQWSLPAQYQMYDWNIVDTTDGSHPFRLASTPSLTFGVDDDDNTIGFLGEAALLSEYGLTYDNALAWAYCLEDLWGDITECDVMLDPSLPWRLVPDDNYFFQSTVLHELGHVRGLDHFNASLSMQNSGTNKKLRDEVLYADDKEGVRQNASHVAEYDVAIYRKWHDGNLPGWMSMTDTTLREGELLELQNLTVENLGTQAFGSLRFGVYLSEDATITTNDMLLSTGTWSSFPRFGTSTFNWSAVIPTTFNDCGSRYVGAIIDDNDAWVERFEGNNAIAFSDAGPNPTPIQITLAEDGLEPNDLRSVARPIALPFVGGNLAIEQDFENDYYRFELTETSSVTIAVYFLHALGNIDLRLQTTGGAVLEAANSVTDHEVIEYDGLAPGEYIVHVYGASAGSCNMYGLAVQSSPHRSGEVSDLRLERMGDGSVRLIWGDSCMEDDWDYAIYEGSLGGSFSNHHPAVCTTIGLQDYVLTPSADDRYFLVVPSDGGGEGSYGRRSDGLERPASLSACAPPVSSIECHACEHEVCVEGAAMSPNCSSCVASICAADSYCCGGAWDNFCVEEVRTICGSYRCAASQGDCVHSVCSEGTVLTRGCDDPPVSPSCVSQICDADSYCCDTAWDDICVEQVESVCSGNCS